MRIKPSLREKKRYLAYAIASRRPISKDLGKPIEHCLKRKLGLFDGSDAGIIHVKYNQKMQRGIIRMDNRYVNKVKVALMLANAPELGIDEDFSIRTLLISGMISKVLHFAS